MSDLAHIQKNFPLFRQLLLFSFKHGVTKFWLLLFLLFWRGAPIDRYSWKSRLLWVIDTMESLLRCLINLPCQEKFLVLSIVVPWKIRRWPLLINILSNFLHDSNLLFKLWRLHFLSRNNFFIRNIYRLKCLILIILNLVLKHLYLFLKATNTIENFT